MNDVDQPFPMVYISFPSAKDPDFTNRHPGRSTIDIITLISAFSKLDEMSVEISCFGQRLFNEHLTIEPTVIFVAEN